MPEAAGADHHGTGARMQQRDGLLGRVIGGQAGVGQGGHVSRSQALFKSNNRPGGGSEQLGESAVGGDARESGPLAVHVVAGPAWQAEAAGHQRVHDHRIAHRYVVDGRAHFLHPSGVFVAQRVREGDTRLFLPLTFDNVEVGSAQAGATDADDDVERVSHRRFGDLLHLRVLAIAV
jgi:hypothetical protein